MQQEQRKLSTLNTFGPMLLAAAGSGIAAATLLMLTVFILVRPAYASNERQIALAETSMNEVKQGSLLFKTSENSNYLLAPTLQTDVSINVTGMVARVVVKQRFTNNSDVWLEGVYVFPLPEMAAVDHMRMWVGEHLIEGQIKIKEEAKRIYEQAKVQGKKTSLLEQERPNLFTTSVANIGPGEEISVEIEYQQTVRYDQGAFSLRFPMTLTPRYIPGQVRVIEENLTLGQGSGWALDTDQVPDASRITPPVNIGENKINPVNLRMEVRAGVPLSRVDSSYHVVDTHYIDQGHVLVNLVEEVPADRDFELRWQPQIGSAPRAAHFSEKKGNYDYHLIMIMPPDDPGTEHNVTLAKEVIYVIDTSGSMEGESIKQAKQSLSMAIDRLHPGDRFNVIEFNSATTRLFSQSRLVTPQYIAEAKHYVRGLQASGGTEMYPALTAALEKSEAESHVKQIIFITDGAVGNEAQLFALINANLGNSRLFTIGIGSAPNGYFMSKAAQFGRGTYTYIGSVTEVSGKMESLFKKLEQPTMTALQANWPKASEVEMWPERLPDVYLGEPLVFVARSSDRMQGELDISGRRSDAQWKLTLPLTQGEPGQGLAVLWAREKMKHLMDSRLDGVSEEKIKTSVTELALEHHLVSKYTSLVAVDVTPSRPSEMNLEKGLVPNHIPHGSKQYIQLNKLARTATPGEINFIVGFVLLLIATLILLISDRRTMAKLKGLRSIRSSRADYLARLKL